jgi:hypothetical protein
MAKSEQGAALRNFQLFKSMFLQKLRTTLAAVAAVAVTATGVGVWAQQVLRIDRAATIQVEPSLIARSETRSPEAVEPKPSLGSDGELAAEIPNERAVEPGKEIAVRLDDGRPDGKQSLGGSGEMFKVEMPEGTSKLTGLAIHGSRYGRPQPPRESFLIYFLSEVLKRILHTEMAPCSLFKRGREEWVEIKFDPPVAGLAKTFWVVLDFRANQTKGVYVSYDTSTKGKFSRVGLPGTASSEVRFHGD